MNRNITTLPRILQQNIQSYPNFVAQYSKDAAGVFQPTTFTELYNYVLAFAAGLRETGIVRGDYVGLISDNRKEWLISAFALHCLGAADVPRGCDTMAPELGYILSFADCKSVIVENESQFAKVLSQREKFTLLERLIVIDNDFDKGKYQNDLGKIKVFGYKDLMEQGKSQDVKSIEAEIEKGQTDDICTIIFTSGTTGEPKGVMLSHKNILQQAFNAPSVMHNKAGEIWLTVLPVWHSFERAIQFIVLYSGGAIAYSKPIGKIMLADFQAIKPQWMTAVPRIWEALRAGVYRNVAASGKTGIFNFFVGLGSFHEKLKSMLLGRMPQYKRRFVPLDMLIAFIPFLLLCPLRGLGNILVFKKIQAMVGGRFIAGVSGGAALPPTVDKFFAAAGIFLLEGYGLTETAPVLAVRLVKHPVPDTIGPAFPEMQLQLRDPETGKEVKPGKKGVLFAKGPQIMKGYYKKPEETAKILDSDGWLNTGDIGMRTHKGEITLTGRAKDTIVLLGGENIEPVPIENKIRESDYIDHALVIGQDQKYLGALVVANIEKAEAYAKENSITYMDTDHLLKLPEIRELIQAEITALVNQKNGFRGFEMIYRSTILPKPFEVGVELSAKQDYKRHVILDMYKKNVKELFSE